MAVPALTTPSGVCLLTGEFPPDRGGVGDYTARLAGALAARGVPVVVLTIRRSGAAARRRWTDGATRAVVPVYAAVPAWDARALLVVARALRKLGPRPLLHMQYQAGAFDLGGVVHLLPLWLRAVLPRARVVTTFHDFLVPYLFPKAGPLRLALNRLLARTSAAAVFTEPADLALAGPNVRGRVVPIGSNLDRPTLTHADRATARARLGADDATMLVGFFGLLNRSKGVPTLLRAVRRLLDDGWPVRLALIGAATGASDPTDLAEAREVRALVAGLGLSEAVTATGYLAPRDVSAALVACDAVALPFVDGASARRGTLMAAIAHGVPIVTTRPPASSATAESVGDTSGAAPDAVAVVIGADALRHGDGVLLVPPGDPAAMAAALARLADDPALRRRIAAGAESLASRIGWGAIAAEHADVYAAALASHPVVRAVWSARATPRAPTPGATRSASTARDSSAAVAAAAGRARRET